MNKDVLLGLVRHILTTGGGVLITKGYADTDLVNAVVGAVVAIVGFIWSAKSKKPVE